MDDLAQPLIPGRLAIVCAHAVVPGRLRFKVLPRPRERWRAEQILARTRSIHSVLRVDFNQATGSFLVAHARTISPAELVIGLSTALAAEVQEFHQSGTHAAVTAPARAPDDRPAAPPRSNESAWHAMSEAEVAQQLRSSYLRGLSNADAARRLTDGTNALPAIRGPTFAELLWRQVGNLPMALLGASALISIATGGAADAVAIAAVIAINAAIGLTTESRAEKVIRSLSVEAPAATPVVRDGTLAELPLEDVVPGDLIVLNTGTYIPADARLVDSDGLSTDESALTGESLPVSKEHVSRLTLEIGLAERRNMVYRGTVVTGGTGRALVVATGLGTELGAIQVSATSVVAPQTPLQQELERTGAQLVKIGAVACGGVLLLGRARGMPWINLVKLAISLGVAAIPEGLPAVATSTLAVGVGRMRKRGVAVRRIGAIEALGSMDTLCFDKTGTLTQNHMRVECVCLGLDYTVPLAEGVITGNHDRPELQRLIEVIALCNDAMIGTAGELAGSATEGALLEFAHRSGLGVSSLRLSYPRVGAHYRSESRRYMMTSHQAASGSTLIAAKGSPAELLARAEWVLDQGRREPLAPARRAAILERNEAWAAQGLRILGVAFAEVSQGADADCVSLVWLGLVGMSDPPRSGVADVVGALHRAGIRPIMITGDQSATAASIGSKLGLAPGASLRVAEARDTSQLTPELLGALAERTHVFARATPTLKLSIVRALQARRRVVGMTGDGVNDGPALRAANVGIAMGRAQQDVAKSVSDIVLEQDELQTVLDAIAEGRTVYDNVRKAIRYLLATNFSELQTMAAALAVGLPVPLNPMQLLWLNLLTDIFPALGLALEPAEPDVLQTKPRDPRQALLGRRDSGRLLRESLLLTGATLGSYLYGIRRYGVGPQASTQAFATLTLSQLFHALTCRSERNGMFAGESRARNRVLEIAITGTVLLQMAALFSPWTRRLLGTSRIGIADLAVIGASSVAPMVINDFLNRRARSDPPHPTSAAARGAS